MLPLFRVARLGHLLPVAKQYEDADGSCPFEEWFVDLHPPAAAKVTAAIIRMEQGNFSNVKAVGPGVFEYKIDFGPGYRIYFGKDGDRLLILSGRWNEEEAAARYQPCNRTMARLQTKKKTRNNLNGFDQRLQNNSSRPGTT